MYLREFYKHKCIFSVISFYMTVFGHITYISMLLNTAILSAYDRPKQAKLEDFYNILNNKRISDDKYKHAQNVWNAFNLKTMRDYHNLYLKSDMLLLADVFKNFRKTCLKFYKLMLLTMLQVFV